ncbi:hypothetical protein [Nakamurella flava]|uniref:hypothetical protein n=1 Tax=Nakamurella flava TaxID=2576308 RepID=UPI00140D5548|nr:hypothetical protein [Nakamurella flava]
MTEPDRTPDASDAAEERAGATEDYGGVPISDEELSEVWQAPDASADAGEPGSEPSS